MGITTNIQWCEASWNPWQGCHKVSAGCKNCYMFRDLSRYGKDPDTVIRSSQATFGAPLRPSWQSKLPINARIFTCSWSDFFIKEADPWRAEAWNIIARTPYFTYLILTKRPERIAQCLPPDWHDWSGPGYPNVWLLVTAENQAMYDKRWPILLKIEARVRGVSAEPLIGPLDLSGHNAYPDWIISGGESGAGCRPASMEWFYSIDAQCRQYKIKHFHKQIGGTKKTDGAWGGRAFASGQRLEFPISR